MGSSAHNFSQAVTEASSAEIAFARGCLKNPAHRQELFNRLDSEEGILADARLRSSEQAAPEPPHIPQGFRYLRWFGDDHPARARLRAQRFDLPSLGIEFGLGFCAETDESLARGRVVAPVYQRGEFAGWIAARFTESGLDFFCAPGMRAGAVVYNLDRAREYPAAVVVPSPDWVWRLGGCAVAPLTAPATERFADTVRSVFRRKQIVLVTPPEREEDGPLAERLSITLSSNFTTVRLPTPSRALTGRNCAVRSAPRPPGAGSP